MEEPIQTEIDQNDMTTMGHATNPFLAASLAAGGRMIQDPS